MTLSLAELTGGLIPTLQQREFMVPRDRAELVECLRVRWANRFNSHRWRLALEDSLPGNHPAQWKIERSRGAIVDREVLWRSPRRQSPQVLGAEPLDHAVAVEVDGVFDPSVPRVPLEAD